MTSMLQDVVREGTARRARALGRDDLAGKTGTTDEYRDAWFIGYNSEVVATAWVGFDQLASLGRNEAGARTALPMWIDYMRVALEDIPEQPLLPPQGIITAYINGETGLPVSDPGPGALEEYFLQGTEGIPVGGTTEPETPESAAAPVAPAPAVPPPPPDTQKLRERLF